MVVDEVHQAHTNLLAVNAEIRRLFANLRGRLLRESLGKFDSPILLAQFKKYGDGYTLRSVPRRAEETLSPDHIVLIVMNSPKLDRDSIFDPHKSLVDIPYWRDQKKLRCDVHIPDGSHRKLLFLVWQQDYPVHGENDERGRSNRNARERKRALCDQLPGLEGLISKQKRKSERLMMTCMKWLASQNRELIVVTSERKELACPIPWLLRQAPVSQVRSPDLFKANPRTMNLIEERVVSLHSGSASGEFTSKGV